MYFVTNILFQTLSNQLRSRQSEVYTLEQMNQIIIEGMSTGVVILNNENQARLMNNAAERFLALPDLEISALRSDVPRELLETVDAWQASRSNGDTQREAVFSLRESGMELRATISELPSSSRDKETLVFLQDNTEVQRQAQQLKLASLVDSPPVSPTRFATRSVPSVMPRSCCRNHRTSTRVISACAISSRITASV